MNFSSQLAFPLERLFYTPYNKGMGLPKSVANHQGQVAILFALVFTFLFVIFAFVVDFGHLIHNKMNLQLAADSAAYAGAAWQARALNQMGAVNYHMRQDYKEMVMRFQVTHTRHNLNFPRGQQFEDGPFEQIPQGYTSPMVCQQAHGFETVRGRRYNEDTNLCRNADPRTGGLPPIVVPPVLAPFDPFSVAIAAQIREIQRQADIECDQAKADNERLVDHLIAVYTNRAAFHAQQMRGIANFVNEGTQENPESSVHPMLAAARESALRNLTDSNKNGNFQFEIIQPEGSQFLNVKEIVAANFALFFDFESRGSACVAFDGRKFFEILVGFEKDPQVLTYFGVKLTSKPQMLFMPQAWLDAAFPTLEAYSLAKPFGSRIGPQAKTDGLIAVPRSDGQSRQLNFSVKPFDNLGLKDSAKLLAFYDRLHPRNRVGNPEGNRNLGWPEPFKSDPIRGPLQAIRTPTIFDAVFFTIFPDPGDNISRDYSEPEFAGELYPDYLEAAGPNNQLIQTRAPASGPYLKGLTGNRGEGWIRVDAPFTAGGSNYDTYAAENPGSHSVTGPGNVPLIGGRERDFGFATKEMYHSAWAPPGEPGRIGYGVKFLSINTLMERLENQTSDGDRIEILNKPRFEPNIRQIQH